MSKINNMASSGYDLDQRDPNNLNEHLQVRSLHLIHLRPTWLALSLSRLCGMMCSESRRVFVQQTVPGAVATNVSTVPGQHRANPRGSHMTPCCRSCCYLTLTTLFAPCLAFCSALNFACLAFNVSWATNSLQTDCQARLVTKLDRVLTSIDCTENWSRFWQWPSGCL